MTSPIPNRQAAGRQLATLLQSYHQAPATLVLALPRGGVPIGYEIARSLNLPLDLYLVRKLGVPGRAELAMGAIAYPQVKILLQDIIEAFHISPQALEQVIAQEQQELQRRALVYRGDRPAPQLQDQTIILVDDGIATGATLQAAIQGIQHQKPHQIIVAVPVAPPSICQALSQQIEQVLCLLKPPELNSISVWYQDFHQISDHDVRDYLTQATIVQTPHPLPT